MQLRLDEQAHIVRGTSRVSFTNQSDRELPELWFHLYTNAFEHNETLFLRKDRDGRAGSRSGRRLRRPGRTQVHSLTWMQYGTDDLWQLAEQHSPGDPRDKTDIRLPLPRVVQPGERVELELSFSTELPELVERSGFEGNFHLISGFYPKLARLSPSGSFEHFAFHPLAEFAGNFGDYRVELDVPETYQIGSTGALIARRQAQGRLYLTTTASDVHDYAWVASPDLLEQTKVLGATTVTVLVPRTAPSLAGHYFEILARLFPHYQERYGAYPHDTLTVVHPPGVAAAAGGMEYPCFITTGGAAVSEIFGIHFRELVTAHEFGHQWFQGIIASNEHTEPWLDESLTTFAEHGYLDSRYGQGSLINNPFLRISELAAWRLGGLDTPEPNALLSAPAYRDFATLARTIYARAPLALETIRRVYGAALDRALREYAEKFRFRHPTTRDFLDALTAQDGDASRALEQLLGGELAGYKIERVRTTSQAHGLFLTEAQIATEGSVSLPASVTITFEEGRAERFPVRGDAVIRTQHTERIRRVCVDEDETILVDPNRINNCFRPSLTSTGQQSLLYSLAALLLSILFT